MSQDPSITDLTAFELHQTSIAALVFLVWENLITLDNEVEYIWPKPKSAWIKSVFLFLRYFPLAIQLCNRALSERVYQQASIGYSALRAWYIAQVVIAHLTMSGVEFVMMARVYALYHNNRWVGRAFICLWLGETITVIIGLVVTLPGVHFTRQLFVNPVGHSFAYLAVATLFSQVILLTLTVAKYLEGEWAGTGFVNLLLRDGSLVFIVFFASTLTAAIYSIRGLEFGMTEYAWYLSLISSAGCRLILNMQRLPSSRLDDSRFYQSSSLELTTFHNELEPWASYHHGSEP